MRVILVLTGKEGFCYKTRSRGAVNSLDCALDIPQ